MTMPFRVESPWMLNRRRLLSVSGLAGASAIWNRWLAAESTTGTATGKTKSVILIFNCGAPSHIDLWDPKPLAPDNIRGKYHPISTNVPGIEISELLPRIARRADKLAIIRSVHHTQHSHNSGMYWSIVGRPYPIDSTLINPSPSDYPCFGTLTAWLAERDGYAGSLPPYVITPRPHCDSFLYLTPGQFGSCLGSRYDPLVLNSDPNDPKFTVPNLGSIEGLSSQRIGERQTLLQQLEPRMHSIESPLSRDLDINRNKAMKMVTSGDVSSAFDLSKEKPEVRDRYGRHSWGQSHLLARRLIESGVRFVTTVNGPSIIWDTHIDNNKKLENQLVPPMETAYCALLDDLEERGLLDSTLVIWMGDFGRTPQINDQNGRDHWPNCYTMVLAGGGIRGGQVVGSSDKIGGTPATRPIQPADVHATVFSAMGYDASSIAYHMQDGRPVPLSSGTPIQELL